MSIHPLNFKGVDRTPPKFSFQRKKNLQEKLKSPPKIEREITFFVRKNYV